MSALVCGTCGGTGTVSYRYMANVGGTDLYSHSTCSACGGSGKVANETKPEAGEESGK